MPRSRLVNLLAAIVVGAVFVAGLFIHGVVGAVLLVAVALLMGYLSAQAWPTLHPRGRRLRVLILAAVIVVAVVKIVTR